MGAVVVAGAIVQCTFGNSPGNLTVTSQKNVMVEGKIAATIKDCAPGTNISPCGMCSSTLNPQVAAATAAALGVLTPQPCMPQTTGTWIPNQDKCLAGGIPCLCSDSILACAYGGVITPNNPGQSKVVV